MLARVRRAHLRADARLALRHHREEEADRIDAFFQQPRSELLRQREKIARGLDALEGYASDGTLRPDEVNLATISAACAIAYLNFRRVAPGWCATRPKLVRLVDSLFQRASFARTEPPVS